MLEFLQHDPSADRAVLEDLADRCERFSPRVGLDPAPQPEGLWLELTGLAQRWGGERMLADQVMKTVRRQDYYGRMALADTLGAAWGWARYAPLASPETDPDPRRKTSRSPATNAVPIENNSDSKAWPALQRIPPGMTRQALRPLPVQALRLSEPTLQLLQRLGIERIGQLWNLPRAGLAARLGDEVLRRSDQATGEREEILVPYRPVPQFQSEWTFESSTTRREIIEHAVQHLCHHVAQQLAAHDQGAIQIRCRLLSDVRVPVDLEVGLFRSTAQASHLFQLLRMHLESVRLAGAVQAVHLQVLTTTPLPCQQASLWEDFSQHPPQQLARLIDRLSSRLGKDAVCGTRLRASILPEKAYTLRPLTGSDALLSCSRDNTRAREPTTVRPDQRPLQLLDPPQRLSEMHVAAEGFPVRFLYQGHSYQVQHHWGPERIETAWWHGPCIRRDYYRVECTNGHRYWLFRHLTDNSWFLHGQFT